MSGNRQKRIEDSNPQGAYTGGAAQNPWTAWFGQQKPYMQTTPYDEKDRSTWVLPEGLLGANITLKNTLELLSFMADSWYTQEALPMETTDQVGIQWSAFIFEPKFAGLVPERGVARLVKSRKTQGRATFERRGLGFLLTHGFMNTPDGRESYRMNLLQISQSVTETNNFGVIYAYLTADDYEKQYDKDYGTYRGDTLEKVLEVDVFYWDVFKRKNGAALLDDRISSSMEKYRGKADMYIVPPKIGRYYTIVPENRTDYWLAGPKGPESIYDGVDAVRYFTALGDSTVYLTRTYDVEPSNSKYGRAIDILRFPAQIGEYHLAFDTRRRRNYKGYQSSWRDIQIYDEDVDNFTTLSLQYLLDNCNRFHPQTGEVLHFDDPYVAKYHPKFSKADQVRDVFHYVDSKKNPQTTSFFGNIEYLSTDDVFEWVQTALQAVPDVVPPTEATDVNNNSYNIWTKGLNALSSIEKIEYNDKVDAWFKALAAANPGKSVHDGSRRFRNFPPSTKIEEFKPNSFGGLILPPSQGLPLPPSFGNYAGFKTIQDAVSNGKFGKENDGLGYNIEKGKDISNFIEMFDRLVEALKRFLPNNPLLNARYASSWWHKATLNDTLFENLVSPHHRDPIFLAGMAGEEGGERQESRQSSFIGAEEEEEEKEESVKPDELEKELEGLVVDYRNAIDKSFEKVMSFDTDADTSKGDIISEETRRGIVNLKKVIELAKEKEWKSLKESVKDEAKVQSLLSEAKAKGLVLYALQELSTITESDFDSLAKFTNTVFVPNVSLGEPLRLLSDANVFSRAFASALKDVGQQPRMTQRKVAGMKNIIDSLSKLSEISTKEVKKQTGKSHVPQTIVQARSKALTSLKKGGKYNRAPITMSPELFTSLFEYSQKGKEPAIWPADPNNPDVALNKQVFEELAEDLGARIEDSVKSGPASLAASEASKINDSLFETNAFAAIRNMNQGLGKSRIRSSISAPIGQRYGETDEIGELTQRPRSRLVPVAHQVGERGKVQRLSVHYQKDEDEDNAKRSATTTSFSTGVSTNLDDNLSSKSQHYSFRRLLGAVNEEASHPLVALLGTLFLTTPTNKRNFNRFITNNLLFPIDFIVARPHARYQTYAVIKARKGRETGATFMGNSNFTLGDDSKTQVHFGTYTYYSKSVILVPKNVYVARNVFVDGYSGGMGSTPYKRDPASYNPRRNVYGISSRKTDSVFVLAVPRGGDRYPQQIDITGRFRSFAISHYGLDTEKELHYDGAYYYNRFWGWQNDNIGVESSMPHSKYVNDFAIPNSIMHEGHTLYFNPNTSAQCFNLVRIANGHYPSKYVYAGCRDAREGRMAQYKEHNWTTGYTNI